MSKRISKKKLAANRKNAQKSTGPKTPEGKARAAKNAIKHGLLAQTVVVHAAHESQTDFDQLLDDLRQDLQPAGPLQETLTERIATCYWRLRRAQRYESGCIEQNFANLLDPKSDTTSSPDYLTDIANLPEEDDLKNLIRYESMIDRQLHRSLHELRQQQKHRQRCLAHFSSTTHLPSATTSNCNHRSTSSNRKNVPDTLQFPAVLAEHATDSVFGTSFPAGQKVTPTAPTSPQVQLPERFSTLDFGPEPARLGGTSEAPLRQTNPNPLQNSNNSMPPKDLQGLEMTTSEAPTDQTDDQAVYQYPNQDDSTGAATEKRRKIQTA